MEPVNLGEKIGTTCYKIRLSCPTLGRAGTRLDFFQADIRGSRGHMSHEPALSPSLCGDGWRNEIFPVSFLSLL